MGRFTSRAGLLGVAVMAMASAGFPNAASAQDGITVALGDIASIESLNLLIALEGVRERGIDVELIEFGGEDMANQAIVNGQADVGIGAPYAIIQRAEVPIRMFYQLSTLRFFAVANGEVYPDWQAMDGGSFAVHTRGSGTEAMARLIEQVEGIQFGEISYVPGSEVRALALLRGNVDATFLDIAGRNLVMEEDPEKFIMLEVPDVDASDETLFARLDWLKENEETARILIEELTETWRKINDDPSFVLAERERLGLLPDLPAELEEEIGPYFEQSVETETFPDDGGIGSAADDFEFFTAAGQLEGEPETLKVEDFWYFAPLEKTLETMGE